MTEYLMSAYEAGATITEILVEIGLTEDEIEQVLAEM